MKSTDPSIRTYSLDELCTLSELPKRTVRYYIQLGLVDRPVGETRAAHYSVRQLEQLLLIRKWSQAGVSLEERLPETWVVGGANDLWGYPVRGGGTPVAARWGGHCHIGLAPGRGPIN